MVAKEGKKIKLNVVGIHCASCVEIIKMNLEDKVKDFKANILTGVCEVEFDDKKTSEKEIKELITKSGYKVK